MPELLIFLFHWFSLKWTNKSLSTFKAECIESVLTWSQTENLFSLVFIKIAVKKITTITAVLSTLAVKNFEKFLSIFMLLVMWGSCQKIIPFLIFMANQHYEKFDVILYFTCFWILTNWKIIFDLRVYTHWAKIKIVMQKLDNALFYPLFILVLKIFEQANSLKFAKDKFCFWGKFYASSK